MHTRSYVESYKNICINTSHPLKLIVMCYEEAINALRNGILLYKEKNYIQKTSEFNKAQGIIGELMASLNTVDGGEIASNLAVLYTFMQKSILEGDLRRDMGPISKVITMLERLLSAWQQLATRERANAPLSSHSDRATSAQRGLAV